MTAPRRPNRGRAAARENRQALVVAALEVFAEQGIGAPLSAVARRAGVGQGSLYRHFPDRISLALAAFEANVAEVEAMAADPGCDLDRLIEVITRQTIDSAALFDIVAGAADPRLEAIVDRVRASFAPAVRRAHGAGRLRADATVDDVILAVELVAALLAKAAAGQRRAIADAAWSLLDRALRP